MALYALVSPADEILGYETFATPPEGTQVAAHKPRLVPVEGQEPPAFDAATQVLEGPAITVEAAAVIWAWTVRGFAPHEVASLRSSKAAQVKAQAAARILNLYPDWKQRNMTARAAALLAIRLDRAWTVDEAAESAELQGAWDEVSAIRAASNVIEAAIPDDAAGIAAFDITAGWD